MDRMSRLFSCGSWFGTFAEQAAVEKKEQSPKERFRAVQRERVELTRVCADTQLQLEAKQDTLKPLFESASRLAATDRTPHAAKLRRELKSAYREVKNLEGSLHETTSALQLVNETIDELRRAPRRASTVSALRGAATLIGARDGAVSDDEEAIEDVAEAHTNVAVANSRYRSMFSNALSSMEANETAYAVKGADTVDDSTMMADMAAMFGSSVPAPAASASSMQREREPPTYMAKQQPELPHVYTDSGSLRDGVFPDAPRATLVRNRNDNNNSNAPPTAPELKVTPTHIVNAAAASGVALNQRQAVALAEMADRTGFRVTSHTVTPSSSSSAPPAQTMDRSTNAAVRRPIKIAKQPQ